MNYSHTLSLSLSRSLSLFRICLGLVVSLFSLSPPPPSLPPSLVRSRARSLSHTCFGLAVSPLSVHLLFPPPPPLFLVCLFCGFDFLTALLYSFLPLEPLLISQVLSLSPAILPSSLSERSCPPLSIPACCRNPLVSRSRHTRSLSHFSPCLSLSLICFGLTVSLSLSLSLSLSISLSLTHTNSPLMTLTRSLSLSLRVQVNIGQRTLV